MRRLSLVLLALLSACIDIGTGPDPDELLGRYELETYDGQSLPAPIDDTGATLISDGWMEFHEGRSCTAFIETTDETGSTGNEAVCQYELSGSKLSIELPSVGGGSFRLTGTWSRLQVSLTDPQGNDWILRRP